MDDLRYEFVVLICVGWMVPTALAVGFRWGLAKGYKLAPRKVASFGARRFDQMTLVSAAPQEDQKPQPAAPALVKRQAGSYARFRWDMLTVPQWRALWCETSEGALCGEGNLFTKGQWKKVRDLLIRLELAYWINPKSRQQGWALTQAMQDAILTRCRGVMVPALP